MRVGMHKYIGHCSCWRNDTGYTDPICLDLAIRVEEARIAGKSQSEIDQIIAERPGLIEAQLKSRKPSA